MKRERNENWGYKNAYELETMIIKVMVKVKDSGYSIAGGEIKKNCILKIILKARVQEKNKRKIAT